jgi:hypothetical protein
MEHGPHLVIIQHAHRSVPQVYKLVVVIVSIKQLVEQHVLVMDFNLLIVQEMTSHINAMVCIYKYS